MFFLAFFISVLLILFLPGFLLCRLLFRDMRLGLLDLILYAFGGSIAINLIICLIVFALRLNILIATILLITVCVLMSAYIWRQQKGKIGEWKTLREAISMKGLDHGEIALRGFALILLFIVVLSSYYVEPDVRASVEDSNIVSIAQKILSFGSVGIDNVFYIKGALYPYIMPFYAYLLSLMSYISGLEVVQIYLKIRSVFTLLTFTTAFSLTRALLPTHTLMPWLVIAVGGISVLTGFGKEFSGGYGQFFSYHIYQDFALCVLLPIAYLFLVRGLLRGDNRYIVLSSLIAVSTYFVHARNALIYMIMCSVICVGMFYIYREKRFLKVLLVNILFLIGVGLTLKYLQSGLPQDLLIYNKDMAQMAKDRLVSLITGPSILGLLYPPLEGESQFFISYNFFYIHPYYLLAFTLVPLLLFFRENRGLVIVGFSLLTPFLIIPIPIVSLLFVTLTYDQFLWGGPALFTVFQLYYIVLSLFLYKGVKFLIDRHFFGVFNYLIVVIICLMALSLSQWLYYLERYLFYLWIYGGALFALFYPKGLVNLRIGLEGLFIKQQKHHIIACFLIIGILILHSMLIIKIKKDIIPNFPKYVTSSGIRFTPLFITIKGQKDKVSVVSWDEWYKESAYKYIPLDVIRFVRERVPQGSIFAVPYDGLKGLLSLSLASMTPQYVYSTQTYTTQMENRLFGMMVERHYGLKLGEYFKETKDIDQFLEAYNPAMVKHEDLILKRYMALLYLYDETLKEYQPFFNTHDSLEVSLNYLKEFDIDYILVTPKWYEHIKRFSVELGGVLSLIYDKEGFAIYKVNKTKRGNG